MAIIVEIKGIEEAQKIINSLAAKSKDLKPVMREVSEIMLSSVQENFKRQADMSTLRGWPILSTKTIKARAKKGKWPGEILKVSGQLFDSIQPDSTNDSATVGTNVEYAAIHHFGGIITIKTREKVITFKDYKRGKRKGLTLFAEKKTRQMYTYSRKIKIGEHQIKIPARPYLTLSKKAIDEIIDTLTTYFNTK